MKETEFTGCKLAYIFDGKLLVYKRDERSDIPFSGQWDFPGGGREGAETPEQCVLRELNEEFSISLDESRLIYRKQYTNHSGTGVSFFFVAQAEVSEIDNISFGDEGQYWVLMPIQEFIDHPEGVPFLKSRLVGYLQASQYEYCRSY